MRRGTMVAMGFVVLLASEPADAARQRTVACCVTLPADAAHEARPYCFNLRVRRPRLGRRICRALDGEVQRPAVR